MTKLDHKMNGRMMELCSCRLIIILVAIQHNEGDFVRRSEVGFSWPHKRKWQLI